MYKKLGFTLAEVLITLGIIGVVAAMTIPTLITKYEKRTTLTQLKQTVSQISNGFKLYMANENMYDLSATKLGSNDSAEQKAELEKIFTTYFKLSQNCNGAMYAKGQYECFPSHYSNFKGTNSYEVSGSNTACQFTGMLMNGVSICADVYGSEIKNLTNEDFIVAFEIDINGPKGPNVWGKDALQFALKSNVQIYDFGYWYHGNKVNLNLGRNSMTGAVGQIMADGWEITYY